MAHPHLFSLAADESAARAAAERLFDEVRRELGPILPGRAQILHIGATAIPGCLTKGDLDIVVRVEQADFAAVEALLASLFCRNEGSTRTDEFAAFEDASRTPHLGVQLTAKDGTFDLFHLFADVLRADPELVRRYNALKLAHLGQPMTLYRAAKNAFITEVLQSCALPAADPRSD